VFPRIAGQSGFSTLVLPERSVCPACAVRGGWGCAPQATNAIEAGQSAPTGKPPLDEDSCPDGAGEP